jgi:CheY-like chemotaxis protein
MYLQQRPTIFIVEDNLMNQQLIARELESLGGKIYFFTTGEDCIAGLDLNPSIVVLDYNLEGQINGLETLEQIRRHDPSIFVVLFSSQRDLANAENQERYGGFNFLEKRDYSFALLGRMVKARMA